MLHSRFDFATYDIIDFNYIEQKSTLPSMLETINLSVSNYASVTGKRLFIVPNVMSRSTLKYKNDDERKFPIVLNLEYTDIDSVEIEIPAGYEVESSLQPVTIATKFGKYTNSIKLDGNKIFYQRTMQQYSGNFDAKQYPDLVNFYDSIYKADRGRVVFVKKDRN